MSITSSERDQFAHLKNSAGVYMVRSLKDGTFYIGQSNNLCRRLTQQRSLLSRQSAYGLSHFFPGHVVTDFEFVVLEEFPCGVLDNFELRYLEWKWIVKLRPTTNRQHGSWNRRMKE